MTLLRLLPAPVQEDQAEEPQGSGALRCERGNLPLVAMSVDADITGLLAAMTIRQTFSNPHDGRIEATYIFPLPDRAAVTGLAVTIGDRHIKGVIQERQAARQAYDDALAAGQRAALLEEDRPDVFTTRIGNLAPGEEATIELTLAGPVPWEFDEATFRVPLVVAPRYIPGHPINGVAAGAGTALDTDAVPDASRITPPVLVPGVANPVRLSVTVRLDPAGLTIDNLRSSLHAAVVAGELPGPVTIEMQPGERLNRDFILRYRLCGDAGRPVTALAIPDPSTPDEGTFVVTALPPIASTAARPRDVVLLLDRSGSMGGWKMVAARRAAARIVDSLTSVDRFAVIAFDDRIERPSGLAAGTLIEATDRNRYRAVEWLGHLEARGGTEMAAALRAAHADLAGHGGEDRVRCCIVVTDGQVGDEDQLVRLATDAGVRLFAVGIDQAVNAGLLRRLAAATGGRCDLVESEDRLDGVLADLQRRINHPVMESLGVRFEGGVHTDADTVTPARPADLYPGVPLVISGRYRGRPSGRVVVAGSGGASMTGEVVAATSAAAAAMWARAHLRDLEDRYAGGTGGALGDDREALAARIVAVSLRYQVLCRFTAWVAVDESGDLLPDNGPRHRIVQPIDLPAGWTAAGAAPGAVFAAAPMSTSAPGAFSGNNVATAPPLPYQPQVPPGAPPQVRLGRRSVEAAGRLLRGRHSATMVPGGTERPTISLLPYYRQLDDLLAAIDGMGGATTTELRRQWAAEARLLASDIASVVGRSALVKLLEALADALLSGPTEAILVAITRLRDARRGAGDGGREPANEARAKPFWR